MNIYDIALDFVLLDAFDDIEHPPSAIVSVLGNTWITAGMKQSVRVITSSPHSHNTHCLPVDDICCNMVTSQS